MNSPFVFFNVLDIGEERRNQFLSDFSCPLNTDVENFLKKDSVDFAKSHKSVSFLAFNDKKEFLGYFALALKMIVINGDDVSKTLGKKFLRIGEYDDSGNRYILPAFLIAQLGKNFSHDNNAKIAGVDLLNAALQKCVEIQRIIGGNIVFLEAEDDQHLVNFYETQNSFKRFSLRETSQSKELLQFLRTI